MTKRKNIDQKIACIMAILLGVVDGVTPNKAAYESIVKVINDEI